MEAIYYGFDLVLFLCYKICVLVIIKQWKLPSSKGTKEDTAISRLHAQ